MDPEVIEQEVLYEEWAKQNNQCVLVPATAHVGSTATRVRDFVRINLQVFLGSQMGGDPQIIIDEVKKSFEVM